MTLRNTPTQTRTLELQLETAQQTTFIDASLKSLDKARAALEIIPITGTSSESTLKATRATIDSTLATLDVTLTALNELRTGLYYSRNMTSPVNHIPREILTEIFLFAIPRTSNCVFVINVNDTVGLMAITISHVCRYWRAIALSTPLLWIRNTPKSVDALRMFLSRSGNIPMVLDISVLNNHSYPNEYAQLLFNQIPRARGLYLDLDYISNKDNEPDVEGTWTFLRALQNMPPSLEYLHIYALEMSYVEDFTALHTMKVMPPNLADENCFPRLRHIFLHSMPIQWGCGLFRNLHTLTLINIYEDPLSLRCLLNILVVCPELKELTIHSVEWEDDLDDISSNDDRLIHLAHLRLARITIYQPSIAGKLLNRIVLSPEANVWLDLNIVALDVHTTEMLVQAFALVLQRTRKPLARLGILLDEIDASIYASVSGSKGAFVLTTDASDQGDLADVTDDPRILSIFNALLGQDLSHLTDFECHFSGITSRSVDWWSQLFSRTTEVRSLGLRMEPDVSNALQALMPRQVRQSDNTTDTGDTITSTGVTMDTTDSSFSISLPRLSRLALTDNDFRDLWLLDYSTIQAATVNEVGAIFHLNHFLVARKENSTTYTDELLVELHSEWHTRRVPPRAVKNGLEAYAEFSVRERILETGFLLDPRFQWDCEFDLDEVKDSLLL